MFCNRIRLSKAKASPHALEQGDEPFRFFIKNVMPYLYVIHINSYLLVLCKSRTELPTIITFWNIGNEVSLACNTDLEGTRS